MPLYLFASKPQLQIFTKKYLQLIPFIFVVYASLAALLDKFINSPSLRRSSDALLLVAFLLFLSIGDFKSKFLLLKKYLLYFSPLIIVLIICSIFNLINNRQLTNGSGLVGIFFNVFIFAFIFSYSKIEINSLSKQASILFAAHIFYIGIETLLLLSGLLRTLTDLIVEYRHLPGQPIYAFLGFDYYVGGANGIFMAPQVASQMLALSMAWFAPFFKLNFTGLNRQLNLTLFITSAILYPFCMTNTSMIMLVVMFLIIIFFSPQDFLIIKKIKIISTILIGLLFLSTKIFEILFYRISDKLIANRYLEIFMDPIKKFIDLPVNLIIFGMQDNKGNLTYTDFGLGAMIWTSGLLLAVTAFGMAIFLSLTACRRIFKTDRSAVNFCFRVVLMATITQLYGWLLSMSHYLVALNLGGKQTLSFFIAIAVYILMKPEEVNANGNLARPSFQSSYC